MGFFSRKEAGSTRRQAVRPRPSVSSEAQAASLRVKARRRLTGAVALVLAVVIVLPMLLDGEPAQVPSGINITIPSKSQPLEPLTTTTIKTPIIAGADKPVLTTEPAPTKAPSGAVIAIPPSTPVIPTPVERPVAATATPSIPPIREAPATSPAAEPSRTDDGSRALALLAGRSPSAAPPAAIGQFVVQIASYSTQEDAQTRRDKLRGEGVSNAFVEQGAIEGKNVFRLRVGPFVSRDAAQAAQTRLRTLGYNNGFITTK